MHSRLRFLRMDLNEYRTNRARVLKNIQYLRATGFPLLVRKMRLDLVMYRQKRGLNRPTLSAL